MAPTFKSYARSNFEKAIRDSFFNLLQNCRPALEEAVKRGTGEVEVEARFTHLSYTEYQRLIKWLNTAAVSERAASYKHTMDYIVEGVRYTLEDDGSIILLDKKRLFNADEPIFDTRISVSLEAEVAQTAPLTVETLNAKASLVRDKKRESWLFENNFRLDLTMVTSTRGKSRKYSYECELEFLSLGDESIKAAQEVWVALITARQNSRLPYVYSELREMITELNRVLSLDPSKLEHPDKELDYTYMAPARNLKYPDLVAGGLIEGKHNYNVTLKVDGERKQLLFYGGGIWLVYPPSDFNLIAVAGGNKMDKLNGFMPDGEIVARANRPATCTETAEYLYIPFDCCAVPTSAGPNKDIQNKSHQLRIKAVKDILKDIIPSLTKQGLAIHFKDFLEVSSSFESLSQAVHKLSSQQPDCFLTDGLMFTPINAPYNTLTDTIPIEERLLTRYPDVCKLKPWKKLTMDLLVEVTSQPYAVLGRGRNNELTPYTGSFRYSFVNSEHIDWSDPFWTDFKSSAIVEFEPEERTVLNEEGELVRKVYLKPLKVRADKSQPNRTDYAGSIWDDINDPLKQDTLEGKTFQLLRHSFNKIKKELYASIPEGATIFELGTGKGGQLYRWNRFSKILGVEPSTKHILEMKKRLKNYDANYRAKRRASKLVNSPLRPRVKVLPVGGEASETILEAAKEWFGWNTKTSPAPFYIVSMLSLSFFWKDATIFNGLMATLQGLTKLYRSCGGKEVFFVFMTIRGAAVKELFRTSPEVVELSPTLKQLKLGPCEMKLHSEKKEGELTPILEINIEDTIVDQQEEYLVSLGDLEKYLPMTMEEPVSADVESCMSAEERSYARLFVSTTAKIGKISDATPRRSVIAAKKSTTKQVEEEVAKKSKTKQVEEVPKKSKTKQVEEIAKKSTTKRAEVEEEVAKKSTTKQVEKEVLEKSKSKKTEHKEGTTKKETPKQVESEKEVKSEKDITTNQMQVPSSSKKKSSPLRVHLASSKMVERISLRYRGRADFLTSRWLNLPRYHQTPGAGPLFEVSPAQRETAPYIQQQFGTAKLDAQLLEYQALGVLSLEAMGEEYAEAIRGKRKQGGVIRAVPSLVNAILTCIRPEYQQLTNESKRYEECVTFYETALKQLNKRTKFLSEDAQRLNPYVKAWLPLRELERLAYRALSEQGEFSYDELSLETDADYAISVKEYAKEGGDFYKEMVGLRDFNKAHLYHDGYFINKVVYTGKDFKSAPEALGRPFKLAFYSEQRVSLKTLDAVTLEAMRPFLKKGITEPTNKTTAITYRYKWIGYNEEIKDHVEYLDSLSNAVYHSLLLKEDRIQVDSIYYNCRGGYLFRHYHSRGKTLRQLRRELTLFGAATTDEEGEQEEGEFYTQCFQFAFLADVYGLNVRAYALPKKEVALMGCPAPYVEEASFVKENPDTIGRLVPNPELKDVEIYNKCSEERIYCQAQQEYSFYTTSAELHPNTGYYEGKWIEARAGHYDAQLRNPLLKKNVDLLEYWGVLGDPNCGNQLSKEGAPLLEVYYHHYEVERVKDNWHSIDTHNGGNPAAPTPIQGIYVPLGRVTATGAISTLQTS